jgi:uncharacterized protein (TIGR03435 family)
MRLLALMHSVLVSLVIAAAASARIPAQGPTAEVRLVHPENGTAPSFEVATVKPSPALATGLRFVLSPAHFAVTHASLRDLVKFAYGIKSDDQMVGLSGWMTTAYFDIQGKAAEPEVAEFNRLDFDRKITVPRLLLQSLLQERFQLKAHVETRDLPVYALVVAKGGPKMTAAEMTPPAPPGSAAPPGAQRRGIGLSAPNQYTASAWSMDQMAEWLGFFVEVGSRPVANETGLKGYYDFVLNGVSQVFPASMNLNGVAAQDPAVSIFAALPDQLGLKLEPKRAPVEVLVIEHVEQPSEN